ncbi:hypothetical protein CRYUN_Cryun05aG0253900 [Craigia yunnanensis]
MEAKRMERRKTMTMNWHGLRDDDDEFFESKDRISVAMPFDLVSLGFDDDNEDFDYSRISFTSTVSSMASVGSVRERRQRLFQGIGLYPDKELLSFKSGVSSKVPNGQVQITPKVPAVITSASKTEHHQNNEDSLKQDLSHSSFSIMFARSRSDGEIESLSIENKIKKELLGSLSKQRLTRTFSLISTPLEKSGFGAFFLIKNLDMGKEFIINEYDQDGMWNKLSDLQIGK